MYELTFMLEDAKKEGEVVKLVETETGTKGTMTTMGERTLAYPIDKKRKAHYFTWTGEMTAPVATALRKKLQFNNTLMRYLLLKV